VPNPADKKELSLDDLLSSATPAATTEAPLPGAVASPSVDGPFKDSSGKTQYRYTMPDGDVMILPKPLEEISDEEFMRLPMKMDGLQAGRIPKNLSVKFKEPQWAGRWFNRHAGNSRRVSEATSLGYVAAKVEDLEWYFHGLNDKDGALTDGDLVLMKIHRGALLMQYKQNMDLARQQGGIDAYKNKASSALSPVNRQNVGYYFTPQAIQEFQGLGPVTQLPDLN
jgi:hypothetical protein